MMVLFRLRYLCYDCYYLLFSYFFDMNVNYCVHIFGAAAADLNTVSVKNIVGTMGSCQILID